MTHYAGVAKIARFNWPWYALAAVTITTGIILLQNGLIGEGLGTIGTICLIVVALWLILSLAVSHYVYDRSPISRGEWLSGIDAATVRDAAIFHAGHDEASDVIKRMLPAANVSTFDFYDSKRNGSPSLERARSLADHKATSTAPDSLPLNDAALDLGLVVFAAHEIRDHGERVAFLRELGRTVGARGRILVVEHLRGAPNFVAYGPGAFHFLSERTWVRSFDDAGLSIMHERSCTPFVHVYELAKAQ